MKRAEKDFSGRITPLFDTMMIQVSKEVGENSDHLTDSTQITNIDQPSTSSQPKKKQPSKKAQRQEVEVPQDETEHEERCSSKGDCCIEEEGLEVRKEEDFKNYMFEETQESCIADIDADVEVTLVDETQESQDDELMFDSGVLDADEMPVEAKVDEKDEQSTKLDDSTPAWKLLCLRHLFILKQLEPKVDPVTVDTTTTTTRPKAKGVVVQEPSEFRVPQEAQPLISKDRGKVHGKIHKPMMEANRLLAERLQSKEREELTDKEKGKLFMELMKKRRKHFAALRARRKRENIPPTRQQKRTQIVTFLKHMESKEKKVEGSEETGKGSRKKMLRRKRAGKEKQQESSKKQRMEEDKEPDEVDEARTMVGVDINTLTMKQYLAFSRENQALRVVKPEIRGNVNFEITSQFMRELREDTFSGNKNEDAHDNVDRFLNIKHFKSLSLDELRSPDFNLLSDKEYSEEEEEEAMAETMEQYISKTRTDYRSGVARPKIDDKDQFELKDNFLRSF
ncbi:hypothetical protein Tco_0845108 [Tanacetum coccineum]